MKDFFAEIRAAILSTLVLVVVCCGVYPLIVFALGQAFFSDKANGSLIVNPAGAVRGSRLIAQEFSDPKYFHPRPSLAGNGYDAANSGASNLGPTSQKLNDLIRDRISAYRADNGLANDAQIPADAVTGSASGLDPHITVQNAELQIARVAKARGVPVDRVRELVRQNTAGRDLGFLGEEGVNVLEVNLALDQIH